MPPETPTDLTSIAVSLGRVEATMTTGFSSINERIDKLTTTSEATTTTLQRHEVDIQLLKSKEQPRRSWVEIAGGIASLLGIASGIGTLIVGLTILAPLLSKLGQ